jgi:hypothetical protein
MLVGALVALGLLAGGTAAQAAERQCVGGIGPETVRGDLVVPRGACDLAGTRVRGSVYVREEAELVTEQADVRGSIEAERDAFVDLVDSAVGGTLALRGSFRAFVEGGSINGNLESTGSVFVGLTSASIGGNVKLAGGSTGAIADGLEVGGTMEALGVEFLDLFDSTVNGDFYVRGALEGSFLCGNTLNGNAELTDNRTLLVIGLASPSCGGNHVNGNVKAEKNQAESEISDSDVGGNLTCFDNSAPPAGAGNRVHGNKEGQCAAL